MITIPTNTCFEFPNSWDLSTTYTSSVVSSTESSLRDATNNTTLDNKTNNTTLDKNVVDEDFLTSIIERSIIGNQDSEDQ